MRQYRSGVARERIVERMPWVNTISSPKSARRPWCGVIGVLAVFVGADAVGLREGGDTLSQPDAPKVRSRG